jgi:aspartate/tyrosine/aromatic aminotransferase
VKTVLFVLHPLAGLTCCLACGGSVVTESPQETAAVRGQIQLVARKQYSNPPIHGALLVSKVLSDPALKQQWYKEVKVSATAPQ